MPALSHHGHVNPERLKALIQCLRETGNTGITRKMLAQKTGISLRTLDRALRALEARGAVFLRPPQGRELKIVLEKGPDGDDHVPPEAHLALRLAGLSLSQTGITFWQEKLQALQCLLASGISKQEKALLERLDKVLRIPGDTDPLENPEVLSVLLKAFEGQKDIELSYQSPDQVQLSTRTVSPFAITHDHFSGGSFLLAWDPHSEKPRHYRLNRIASVTVTDHPAFIPCLDLMERAARYQIGGWTSDEPPFEVEALVHGAHWVQSLKETPPGLPDFECDPTGPKQGRMRFKANHEFGARRFLLQFGSFIEVLKPHWLRKSIQQELSAAMERYQTQNGT